MLRNEIDSSLKWDLSKIYISKKDFYSDYEAAKKLISNIEDYKNIFLSNSETFIKFMLLIEKTSRILSKLSQYTHLSVDVEPDNDILQNMHSEVQTLYTIFSTNTTFITSEIIKNDSKSKEILNSKEAFAYKKYISDILRNKPHILSDDIENILANVDDLLDSSYKTYSVIRPDFSPIVINGKEYFLNEETQKKFLKNKDENIRKQAYNNVFSEYKKLSNVFSNTLIGNLKKDVFLSKVRKFDTPLESSLFEDEVPKELFYKVLDMANNKYHSYLLDYVDTIKKVLNKENLFIYDTSLPLVDNINFNYSLEDAYKLIIEATKNLGPTYKKVLQKARVENWIDYMPHKGKRHGAYSSGSYDTSPYILMSYTNDIESIFTLIHELGHSIHTYFSNTTQPYFTHSYRIFVAEVASTVNENLLMYTLLKNSSTKEEKAFLLYRKLQENIGLLYRQPFFANFEDLLHKKLANNETLSNKFITDLYESLTNDYWGNKVQLNEYTKYSCYYIPHFYYNYYVYKYTVGQCVASVIAKKIFNNDEKQIYSYLNFLKSGSSKSPIELLKDTGVNPLEDNIYDDAFREFKQTLDEFNNLI